MKYKYWRQDATQDQMLRVGKLIFEAEQKIMDAAQISHELTMRAPLVDLLLKRARELRVIWFMFEDDVYKGFPKTPTISSLKDILKVLDGKHPMSPD